MIIFQKRGKNITTGITSQERTHENDYNRGKIQKIYKRGQAQSRCEPDLDGSFAVHDIKIVQGEERLFVAMPSRRDDNGVFRDIVHPIDSELRNEIEGEILSAYRMELDRQAAEQQDLS